MIDKDTIAEFMKANGLDGVIIFGFKSGEDVMDCVYQGRMSVQHFITAEGNIRKHIIDGLKGARK